MSFLSISTISIFFSSFDAAQKTIEMPMWIGAIPSCLDQPNGHNSHRYYVIVIKIVLFVYSYLCDLFVML